MHFWVFKMIDIRETLELFMELQTLGDKVLRKLAFSHVIHSIRRLNLKHKNDPKNRELQSILFAMLQVLTCFSCELLSAMLKLFGFV